jgi:hypothetical protein
MEHHIESVKAFYKFLVSKGYSEDILNNTASFQEFKDDIANKYNLSASKEKNFWDVDILIEFIEILDDYFDRNKLGKMYSRDRKKFFKFLVLRIFIKITLSTSLRWKI